MPTPKPKKMTNRSTVSGPYRKAYRPGTNLWHVLGTEDGDDVIVAEVTVEDIADLLVQELENQDKDKPQLKPLTEESKYTYLRNPFQCPYCGDTRLDTGPFHIDGDGIKVTVHVTCLKCKKEWHDVHKLMDMVPIN